jgi:septum formation inhibitor-activating ATPase MinD
MEEKKKQTRDKDHLSQEDLEAGIKTFEDTDKPHAVLETPEGKNNGAEPAVYQNQQKFHP